MLPLILHFYTCVNRALGFISSSGTIIELVDCKFTLRAKSIYFSCLRGNLFTVTAGCGTRNIKGSNRAEPSKTRSGFARVGLKNSLEL